MDQEAVNERVGRYYNKVQWLYNIGWAAGGTRSLHYGLWYDDTTRLGDAIVNGDSFVGRKLQLTADDVVLDAGCGVGASSIYLAKHYGCRVVGVTISEVQLEQAKEAARRSGFASLLDFKLMDFTKLGFEDNTFTKVFTQETSVYAVDKLVLLSQIQRVLKPGGRYLAFDPFLRRDVRTESERRNYEHLLRGWGAPALERYDDFLDFTRKAGLDLVEHDSVHERTTKSSKYIWYAHAPLYPLVYVGHRLGVAPSELLWHFQASLGQRDLMCDDDSLIVYAYVLAQKPTTPSA